MVLYSYFCHAECDLSDVISNFSSGESWEKFLTRYIIVGSCGKTYYLTQKIPVIVVYCPKCTNQHVECKYETHEGNETPV